MLAEKWMETKRFEEEQCLLKTEMSNFLAFYKNRIFSLRQRREQLETMLTGIVSILLYVIPVYV